MIIIVKPNYEKEKLENLKSWINDRGLKMHESKGENSLIIGLVGDTSCVDIDGLLAMDIIESVKRVQEPYKKANRKFHPEDTIFDIAGRKVGGSYFNYFAGPCSIESEKQIISIAESVKKSGAHFLRGGAYKPRTSPYAFQGLRESGLDLLIKAKEIVDIPIVTEIMNVRHIDYFKDVDIIQIGARNMQNFELLKELGRTNKPILLKRGLANTIEEWLMSAEYIMSEGNLQVILCERGIRTFEPYTRNTLDLSAIPLLKELTHLPVIVDPSHASGISRLVEPLSLAAAAAGSNGLMIEVHNDPEKALCDGAQCIKPDKFDKIVKKIATILPVVEKIVQRI